MHSSNAHGPLRLDGLAMPLHGRYLSHFQLRSLTMFKHALAALLAATLASSAAAGTSVLPDAQLVVARYLGAKPDAVIITQATFADAKREATPTGRLATGNYADQWRRFEQSLAKGGDLYHFRAKEPTVEGYLVIRDGAVAARIITLASFDEKLHLGVNGVVESTPVPTKTASVYGAR